MKIPIYQSLIRHKLLYGMERTPARFLLLADVVILFQFDLISSILAFNRYSAFVILIMVSVNLFMVYLLREIAKRDTQMLDVYLRNKRYQSYYSARSSYLNSHLRKGNLLFKPINWKG